MYEMTERPDPISGPSAAADVNIITVLQIDDMA